MKKAFTLAEVLITLGIIGVVAAMTMPTLIANHQKQVYVSQLKKSVSIISQGFTKYLADEGIDNLSNSGLMDDFCEEVYNNGGLHMSCSPVLSLDNLDDMIYKYFKIVKNCNDGSCDFSNYDLSPCGPYIFGCHGNVTGKDEHSRTYILADGTILQVINHSSSSVLGFVDLNVDINGFKGPNKLGKDIFKLVLTGNGAVKGWYDSTDGDCKVSGWNCAHDIMETGWQMNY